MSPFFVLYLFLLLSAVALEEFLASKPQERRSSSLSAYGILFFCPVGLARSVALRSPQGEALRAKCRAKPTRRTGLASSVCTVCSFWLGERRRFPAEPTTHRAHLFIRANPTL